jgi:tetrahydromethanopterin S-methyltransferase subunit H
MLTFSVPQKEFQVGNVTIGGPPGQNPPVLCGSIFFTGHLVVKDPQKGVFDHDKVKRLLDRDGEASEQTGIPRMIDIQGETAEALIKYTEFVAVNCEAPMAIDSAVPKARMETIEHFKGSELIQRIVYNSIGYHHTEEELECIRMCGVKTAVVMPFSTRAVRPKGRIKLLNDKLLAAAEKAGVEKILVDTGVLDIPSISWSSKAIWDIKDKLGFPCGCSPLHMVYHWKKMKAQGSPSFEAAAATLLAHPLIAGADFLFYGPMRNATWVYAACAAVAAMMAYGETLEGIRPIEGHPLYRIL